MVDLGERRVADEHRGAAVVELSAQLGRREADVEREQHRAGEQHAVVGLEQLVAVAAEPRDAVARMDVEVVLQDLGQPRGALGHVGVGEDASARSALVLDHALSIGKQAPCSEQEVDRGERELHQLMGPRS